MSIDVQRGICVKYEGVCVITEGICVINDSLFKERLKSQINESKKMYIPRDIWFNYFKLKRRERYNHAKRILNDYLTKRPMIDVVVSSDGFDGFNFTIHLGVNKYCIDVFRDGDSDIFYCMLKHDMETGDYEDMDCNYYVDSVTFKFIEKFAWEAL